MEDSKRNLMRPISQIAMAPRRFPGLRSLTVNFHDVDEVHSERVSPARRVNTFIFRFTRSGAFEEIKHRHTPSIGFLITSSLLSEQFYSAKPLADHH